jgi:hypothetical protein
MSDPILENLLSVDPLGVAETLTGKSYKDDAGTMSLGFFLAGQHNASKLEALAAAGDTRHGITYDEFERLVLEHGFESILKENFKSEVYQIFWHPEGLLLASESFHRTTLNTAKVYYNWKPYDREIGYRVISSGHYTENLVWSGDHDAREGLFFNLDRLRENGSFLPVWEERPWLWLLNYTDSKVDGYDHEAITASKIARFPEDIQASIKGEDE